MSRIITAEEKKEIVSYYKQKPITIDEVAEKFCLCKPTIAKILDEYRIKRYSKSQLFSPNLNEHYFQTIDTEKKAYFLGLILTDGCVYSAKGKSPIITIVLKQEDEYLLQEFLDDVKSNKKITHDGKGCSEVAIVSKTMAVDLATFGVVPNKSLITFYPVNIPENMYCHFIRGVLDGDGSVSYYARRNRKSHTKAIRFCQGSERFLQGMMSYLHEKIGIPPVSTYKEKEHLWSIAYRKNISMIKIIDYMYADAHIYMIRKKRLCDLVYTEACKNGNTEITDGSKESWVS